MYPNSVENLTQTQYEELLDYHRQLTSLSEAGVDNWEGYSFAMEIYEEKNRGRRRMKLYKLTDSNDETRNHTKWGENVTHTTSGVGGLCSEGWLHAYLDPRLAVILNPIHTDFNNPNLWIAEGEIGLSDYQLKVGCKSLTTLRKIPLPEINIEQRITFAILCVKKVYKDSLWNSWADKWLSGEDRSKDSANAAIVAVAAAAYAAADNAAAATAVAATANATANAAATAVAATAYAATAAVAVANAATAVVAYAAYAAAVVPHAHMINLIEILDEVFGVYNE